MTTCTAATAYGATRSIRSQAPASAISTPTIRVGTRKSDGLATIPLQENSATHPASRPSIGGPGRQPSRPPERSSSEIIWEVIGPAPPGGRQGAVALERGRLPPAGAQRSGGRGFGPTGAVPRSTRPAPRRAPRRRRWPDRPGSLRSASPRWPSTASSMPPCWDSSTQPVESCSLRVIRIRASRSSCSDRVAPWAAWCQPCAEECPVALTSRTSKSSATRLRMIDAAARTAVSIEESTP